MSTAVVALLATSRLVLGVGASYIVAGMLTGGYALATKIVDAIMAGATAAAIAGLLLTSGLGPAWSRPSAGPSATSAARRPSPDPVMMRRRWVVTCARRRPRQPTPDLQKRKQR